MRGIEATAADARRAGNRVVIIGVIAIVAILTLAAIFLFLSLPDANAFNGMIQGSCVCGSVFN